jgi:hypothetical protein
MCIRDRYDIVYDSDPGNPVQNYPIIIGSQQGEIGSFYVDGVDIGRYSGALVKTSHTGLTGSELIVKNLHATIPSAQIASGSLFEINDFTTVELHDIHNPYSGTNVTNGMSLSSITNFRMYNCNLECDEVMLNASSDPVNLVIKNTKLRGKTEGFNFFYAEPTSIEVNNVDLIVPSSNATKTIMRLEGVNCQGAKLTDVRMQINYTDASNDLVPHGILLKNCDQAQLKNITMNTPNTHTSFDTTTVGEIVFLNSCDKVIVTDATSFIADGINTLSCNYVIGRNIIYRVGGAINPTSGSTSIDITGTAFGI